MKTFLMTLLVSLSFILTSIVLKSEEPSTDKITKSVIKTSAQCEECKERIETSVNELDGIKKANLDVETKELTVEYDADEVDLTTIKKQVASVGYDADDIPSNKKAYKSLPKCCQLGDNKK